MKISLLLQSLATLSLVPIVSSVGEYKLLNDVYNNRESISRFYTTLFAQLGINWALREANTNDVNPIAYNSIDESKCAKDINSLHSHHDFAHMALTQAQMYYFGMYIPPIQYKSCLLLKENENGVDKKNGEMQIEVQSTKEKEKQDVTIQSFFPSYFSLTLHQRGDVYYRTLQENSLKLNALEDYVDKHFTRTRRIPFFTKAYSTRDILNLRVSGGKFTSIKNTNEFLTKHSKKSNDPLYFFNLPIFGSSNVSQEITNHDDPKVKEIVEKLGDFAKFFKKYYQVKSDDYYSPPNTDMNEALTHNASSGSGNRRGDEGLVNNDRIIRNSPQQDPTLQHISRVPNNVKVRLDSSSKTVRPFKSYTPPFRIERSNSGFTTSNEPKLNGIETISTTHQSSLSNSNSNSTATPLHTVPFNNNIVQEQQRNVIPKKYHGLHIKAQSRVKEGVQRISTNDKHVVNLRLHKDPAKKGSQLVYFDNQTVKRITSYRHRITLPIDLHTLFSSTDIGLNFLKSLVKSSLTKKDFSFSPSRSIRGRCRLLSSTTKAHPFIQVVCSKRKVLNVPSQFYLDNHSLHFSIFSNEVRSWFRSFHTAKPHKLDSLSVNFIYLKAVLLHNALLAYIEISNNNPTAAEDTTLLVQIVAIFLHYFARIEKIIHPFNKHYHDWHYHRHLLHDIGSLIETAGDEGVLRVVDHWFTLLFKPNYIPRIQRLYRNELEVTENFDNDVAEEDRKFLHDPILARDLPAITPFDDRIHKELENFSQLKKVTYSFPEIFFSRLLTTSSIQSFLTTDLPSPISVDAIAAVVLSMDAFFLLRTKPENLQVALLQSASLMSAQFTMTPGMLADQLLATCTLVDGGDVAYLNSLDILEKSTGVALQINARSACENIPLRQQRMGHIHNQIVRIIDLIFMHVVNYRLEVSYNDITSKLVPSVIASIVRDRDNALKPYRTLEHNILTNLTSRRVTDRILDLYLLLSSRKA